MGLGVISSLGLVLGGFNLFCCTLKPEPKKSNAICLNLVS